MGRGGFEPPANAGHCPATPLLSDAEEGVLRVKEVVSDAGCFPTKQEQIQPTQPNSPRTHRLKIGVSHTLDRKLSSLCLSARIAHGLPAWSQQLPTMYDNQVTPERAVEQYLQARRHELADSSHQNQGYRLNKFVQWTNDVGFDDMRELDGRVCEKFKVHRTSRDLSPNTIRNHLMTFRVFVRWCEANEYVTPGTADKIRIPTVRQSDRSRDEHVKYEVMQDIIGAQHKYEYGTLRCLTVHLLWHTGMRMGSARALDLDDWHPQEQYLTVRHRPETGTPLKREYNGERNISILDSRLSRLLEDWIQFQRPDITDDYGRDPLLVTSQGRASKNTIRNAAYRATQPCEYTGHCPHEEEKSSCKFRDADHASKCPSSVSPHPLRRSAITHHLNQDVPIELASERMNVSVDTLEEHYDARSQEEKRQVRRRRLENMDF
jgi:site-specific recombinase XerD